MPCTLETKGKVLWVPNRTRVSLFTGRKNPHYFGLRLEFRPSNAEKSVNIWGNSDSSYETSLCARMVTWIQRIALRICVRAQAQLDSSTYVRDARKSVIEFAALLDEGQFCPDTVHHASLSRFGGNNHFEFRVCGHFPGFKA